MYTGHEGNEEYHTLKEELNVLSSSLKKGSDSNIELSAIALMKDKIRQYIKKAEKAGIEMSHIEEDLDSLRTELIIPTTLWSWTKEEVAEAKQRLTKEMSAVSQQSTIVQPTIPKASLFSKEILYHASLCCAAVNTATPMNAHSYFRDKNPCHEFTEVSFSQNKDNIAPYLIARNCNVLYVAFQSTPSLSKWTDTATSFDEG